MDIKKANVNLLLGKIRTYLDAQPEAKKKGKRFMEAEKAVAKLEKIFLGKDGEPQLVACRRNQPVLGG
jgi:dihydroorotase